MKYTIFLLLILTIASGSNVHSQQVIDINPQIITKLTGTVKLPVSDNDFQRFKLDKITLHKEQFFFGTITLTSDRIRDAFSAIKYKVYLNFEVERYYVSGNMTYESLMEFDNELESGSAVQFALRSDDIYIYETRAVTISALVMSGSIVDTKVTIEYDLSIINVPSPDTGLLADDLTGSTRSFPAEFL